jgi:hypothetical protein
MNMKWKNTRKGMKGKRQKEENYKRKRVQVLP